jgi:hypothetical protein
MALPDSFELVDEHGTVIGTGTADERWVSLTLTDGDETGTTAMRPSEWDAVTRTLPQFQHITIRAT